MKPDVAVVIGRFQVVVPTKGHRDLLWSAAGSANGLMVLVGESPAMPDKRNPIPAEIRVSMLKAITHDVHVLKDCRTNEQWSAQIDALIGDRSAVLWGGRDSCLDAYSGKHPVRHFDSCESESGTQCRKRVDWRLGEDFRAGMVYAQNIAFPRVYPTVDIVLRHNDKVLVGRKPDESLWRFPGGFVDVADESLESAALRELQEETGITLTHLDYLTSRQVNDWRYRGSMDKIMTTVFTRTVAMLEPTAGDDLDCTAWKSVVGLNKILVPEHRFILQEVLRNAQ